MIRVVHPGSGSGFYPSQIPGSKRHWILDPDPQHWLLLLFLNLILRLFITITWKEKERKKFLTLKRGPQHYWHSWTVAIHLVLQAALVLPQLGEGVQTLPEEAILEDVKAMGIDVAARHDASREDLIPAHRHAVAACQKFVQRKMPGDVTSLILTAFWICSCRYLTFHNAGRGILSAFWRNLSLPYQKK